MGLGYITMPASETPSSLPSTVHWQEAVALVSMRKSAAAAAATKLLQSGLTVCDPMDSSPPGSSVHGTLQARILEWVASSFSGKSARPTEEILPVEIGLLLL